MQLLRADTSTKVVIGPVVAVGDGYVPVTTLSLSTADEAEILKHDAAAVTDISGNTFAAITGADGYYNLTITAAQTDTEGRLTVLINDDSLCLPVRHDFMVVNANVFDSLYAAATTDYLQVDTTQVGGTAQTANDMSGDVDTLLTRVVGTLASGTHTAQTGDVYALANGANGFVNIKSDTAAILTDTRTSGVLLAATATSPQLVDDVWDEVLTAGTHNVANSAARRLRGIQEFQGYEDGAIWVDTVNGSAGTTSYENGTVENPVNSIADANTINTSLTFNRFHFFPASSIVFSTTQSNQVFIGREWTLALGGQNIAGSEFEGANVSGIGTGASSHFQYCSIGNTTLGPGRLGWCGLSGTLTIGSAGNFFIHDCYSEVAGASSPTLDMGGGVGATNVSIRRWAGGLTINNLASGDVVSIDGTFGTITLNGADAQVEIRGIAKAVVNNLTGSPTVNDNTIKETQIDAIEADTQDLQTQIGTAGAGLTALPWNAAWDTEVQSECTDALNAYDPPTKSEMDALLTTAMTESYAADGATMTPAQALYMIWSMLAEASVASTTLTTKKLDGSTSAMTFTINDATTPTSITRAT